MGAAFSLMLLLRAFGSAAQDVTEPALKSAFIYSFAKFTDWPEDTLRGGATMTMCVAGDDAVAESLARTVAGRDSGGHPISVRKLTDPGQAGGCHVLYLSNLTPTAIGSALSPVRDQPILTLSDVGGASDRGSIAFFYFEHGKLRFHVDTSNLKRSRLGISSRLLQLSKQP